MSQVIQTRTDLAAASLLARVVVQRRPVLHRPRNPHRRRTVRTAAFHCVAKVLVVADEAVPARVYKCWLQPYCDREYSVCIGEGSLDRDESVTSVEVSRRVLSTVPISDILYCARDGAVIDATGVCGVAVELVIRDRVLCRRPLLVGVGVSDCVVQGECLRLAQCPVAYDEYQWHHV